MRLTGVPETTARPVRASVAAPDHPALPAAGVAASGNATGSIVTSVIGVGSKPPFDTDRVAQIRKAIEENRYPIIPAQIADAMIAAKLYGIIKP